MLKNAFATTLLMAIVAAVSSACAAYFYPWPEAVVVSEAVNQPLFDDYDTRSVRSIRLTQYNSQRNELEQLQVHRRGERWVLPQHQNFVANRGSQVSAAVNSLLNRIVLEKKSDDQQDHLEYGVVDPVKFESTPNRSALGQKIVLADRNKQELASLIVGAPLKSDPRGLKRYVRIPGQPGVYVIEFDPNALNMNFPAWVDSNLLQFTNETPLKDVTIEHYRIDPQKIADGQRQPIYEARLQIENRQLDIQLKVADDEGELKSVEVNTLQSQQVRSVVRSIIDLAFTDVRAKDDDVAKLLANPDKASEPADFASTQPFGFRATEFENNAWQFDAVGGEVAVRTEDGVVITILVGAIDTNSRNSSLKLNHYLMLVAGLDESLVPMPEKDSDDSKESASGENSDAEPDKTYLRKVAARDQILATARQRAAALNKMHADWYYIVTEDLVNSLIPDLTTQKTSTRKLSQPEGKP